MKSLAIIRFSIVLSLLSSVAVARGGYLFETTFANLGFDYLERLNEKNTDVLSALPVEKQNSCLQRYNNVLEDGVIDIRIALGYFDWTTGSEVQDRGGNYGFSPSMDLGAFHALKTLLLSPCNGNARFCGFKQDPANEFRFFRAVTIHGSKYLASVDMQFSSATEFLNDNIGIYRDEQNRRTNFMENYFKQALQNADAVFYFGHSRNGGGPDFSPPVFVKGKNKVDYDGYYEVKRPGLKMLMAALGNEKKAPILGLMSCASREHFLNKMREIAPETGVITSRDVLQVDYVYTAMIGGIDAILRGQCQRSFYESLRLTPGNQENITMDGMFK